MNDQTAAGYPRPKWNRENDPIMFDDPAPPAPSISNDPPRAEREARQALYASIWPAPGEVPPSVSEAVTAYAAAIRRETWPDQPTPSWMEHEPSAEAREWVKHHVPFGDDRQWYAMLAFDESRVAALREATVERERGAIELLEKVTVAFGRIDEALDPWFHGEPLDGPTLSAGMAALERIVKVKNFSYAPAASRPVPGAVTCEVEIISPLGGNLVSARTCGEPLPCPHHTPAPTPVSVAENAEACGCVGHGHGGYHPGTCECCDAPVAPNEEVRE